MEYSQIFISTLLSEENLCIKKVKGEEQTGELFLKYIRCYKKLFEEDKLPRAKKLLMVSCLQI